MCVECPTWHDPTRATARAAPWRCDVPVEVTMRCSASYWLIASFHSDAQTGPYPAPRAPTKLGEDRDRVRDDDRDDDGVESDQGDEDDARHHRDQQVNEILWRERLKRTETQIEHGDPPQPEKPICRHDPATERDRLRENEPDNPRVEWKVT